MSEADAYLLMISLGVGGIVMLSMLWVFDEMRRVRVECSRIAYMMQHDRANKDMAVRGLWDRSDRCARNWNAMARWTEAASSRVYQCPLPPILQTNGGAKATAR